MEDHYNLKRFKKAQESREIDFEFALNEIRLGKKREHWIWYIFPQGPFGISSTSLFFSIRSLQEARAYLDDPILGARLRLIIKEILVHGQKEIFDILGFDANKFQASMTLFSIVDKSEEDLFSIAIQVFFKGEKHKDTIDYFGSEA
jgi:uncharacterized protein (DUF1810 family)